MTINGTNERVVVDQIQNALKTVTERMEQKSAQTENQEDEELIKNLSTSDQTSKVKNLQSQRKKNLANKVKKLLQNEKADHEILVKDQIQNHRNVVIFTGKALTEIMRDQTMIKSFITLAYISNMMVGSEITPLQK